MASLGFHFLATNLCDYCPFYRLHSSIGIRRKNLRTACSAADDVQESMETGDGWSGEASSVASESPVSTSKRASSIISTLNVQKAMRGIGNFTFGCFTKGSLFLPLWMLSVLVLERSDHRYRPLRKAWNCERHFIWRGGYFWITIWNIIECIFCFT